MNKKYPVVFGKRSNRLKCIDINYCINQNKDQPSCHKKNLSKNIKY